MVDQCTVCGSFKNLKICPVCEHPVCDGCRPRHTDEHASKRGIGHTVNRLVD
jgi:hypothetical protein